MRAFCDAPPGARYTQIILTGGQFSPETSEVSAAARMRDFLVNAWNIPSEFILVEDLARDTFGNLLFTWGRFSNPRERLNRMGVVTDPLHGQRILLTCAKEYGISASLIVADYKIPWSRWVMEWLFLLIHWVCAMAGWRDGGFFSTFICHHCLRR